MKEHLLELIDKTEEIEGLFYISKATSGISMVGIEIIYTEQEFQIWLKELKCELQEIYDRTKDNFIWDTINDVSANFNGWRDRVLFDKVKGDLIAIKRKIDSYYPVPESKTDPKIEVKKVEKKPKVFISHSSKDIDYVAKIVALLDDMGLDDSQLFCSSMPGYDIPLGKDIFSYLRDLFQDFNLHVIFIHSLNYYDSAVSMNEMGAAWVLRSKYTSILLPGFDFTDMKGVVDNKTISIKLDNSETEVKDKLNQLYGQIIQEFGIRKKKDIIWEQKRDNFIKETKAQSPVQKADKKSNLITEIKEHILSAEAKELLMNASKATHAQIMVISTLSGKSISVGTNTYSESMGIREFAKWDSAMDELIQHRFIKAIGTKNEIFQVTDAGFKYVEAIAPTGD